MEEFGDDNLRRVFGKLHDAESVERGAEWSEVESKLPPVSGHRRWMTASALLLMIGFVSVNGLFWLRDDDQQAQPNTPLTLPDNRKEERNETNDKYETETKPIQLDPVNKRKSAPTSVLVNSMVITADEVFAAEDLKLDPSVETDVLVPANDELHSDAVEEVDTVVTIASPGEEQKDCSPRFQLSAGYLFGVVTPDPNDRMLISDYQTKSGAAAKIQVDYPVVSSRYFTIRGTAFFHTVYKPFQFDVLEYGLEKINTYSVRKIVTQHHFGLGLAWVPARGPWEVHAGFSSLLSNRKPELLSSRWLHVSVSRGILHAGKKFEMLGSVEVLAPLSGQSNYIRYVPIQLSLGLRRR